VIRFVRLGLDQARAALAPMVGNPKWDTSDGLYGVDGFIGGGVAFEVLDAAGPVAVLVVQQVQHENGTELEIRVARQLSARLDLTAEVLPVVESHFGAGCNSVSVWTRRPGLVRKLSAAGYGQAAVMMRKGI
jgi:acyl-coenzyme A thioesterase PaaI-like protein